MLQCILLLNLAEDRRDQHGPVRVVRDDNIPRRTAGRRMGNLEILRADLHTFLANLPRTVSTAEGQFTFNVAPYGVSYAPSTFTNMMHRVLPDRTLFVDDIWMGDDE